MFRFFRPKPRLSWREEHNEDFPELSESCLYLGNLKVGFVWYSSAALVFYAATGSTENYESFDSEDEAKLHLETKIRRLINAV